MATLTTTYTRYANVKVGSTDYGDVYIRIYARYASQSIENNTSKVYVQARLQVGARFWASSGTGYKATCTGLTSKSGTKLTSESNMWQTGETTLTTLSGDVTHGSDGKKTLKLTARFYSSPWDWDKTAEASVDLPTIPRASDITVNNTTLDVPTNIVINRKSASFTEQVYIKDADSTIETLFTTIGGSTGDQTFQWTPSLNLYAPLITTSSTKTFTLCCETYNEDTLIGTKTTNVVLTVPTSVKPTLTESNITISPVSDVIPSSWNMLVKGKSKAKITLNPTALLGATISRYNIKVGDESGSTREWITSTLNTSGTLNAKVTVTDSRGYSSNEVTKQFIIEDYIKPSIEATITRCDASGNEKNDGTYLKYSCHGSITPLNNHNLKEFAIRYRVKGTSTYTTKVLDNTSYTINHDNHILSGVTFSADNSYDIVFVATDSFESIPTEKSLDTGFDIINVHKSGKSVAIGKKSEATESEEKLEVALTSEFSKDIKALEDLDVQGNATIQGNSTISGNNTITGDTYIGGNLKVGKNITTDPSNAFQTTIFGTNNSGYRLKTIRSGVDGATGFNRDCTGVAFSAGDTHGYVYTEYPSTGRAWMGGGNQDKLNWKKRVFFYEDILNFFYPVGSIYIMPTNTSPETLFGGTWELIDKEFIPLVGNYTSYFTRNTTNTSEVTYCAIMRAGHSIRVRINLKNKVTLDDDNLEMGTLKLSSIGITTFSYTQTIAATVNDAVLMRAQLNGETGVLTHTSLFGTSATVAADSSLVYEFKFVVSPNSMLNDHCNKFYWKRIS